MKNNRIKSKKFPPIPAPLPTTRATAGKVDLLSPRAVRILRILRAILQIKSELLLLQDETEGHDELDAVRKSLAEAAIKFNTDPFREHLWNAAREQLMIDFARAFPNDVLILSRPDGTSSPLSVLNLKQTGQ